MFAKAYRLKSNNTLKNSEKKHLAQLIQDEFPGVTEENVKELVPVKSNSSCMKLELHSGRTVGVYVVDGLPVFIETEQGLAPTVCALWKVPDLVPVLIIHTPVLPKMVGGAPLYLPGVSRGAGAGAGWRAFERGAVVAACTQDNRAACVVGRATLAGREMVHLVAGVCLETIHVYGDLLCKDPKLGRVQRPKLGPAAYPGGHAEDLAAHFTQLNVQPPPREEWPSLGRPSSAPSPSSAPAPAPAPGPSPAPANLPATIPELTQQTADLDTTEQSELEDTMLTESSLLEEESVPSDMDGLLQWCLLSFLKLEGKRLELPLKTNLLYKNHLMPLCPPDRTLDVRKSSYKKMGKFLEAMQNEGLLEVREVDKGVAAIVAVHLSHPRIRAHVVPASVRDRTRDAPQPAAEYAPPVVQELYCLTAAVMDLFPQHKKGTAVTTKELRAGVTEYVRAHKLVLDSHRDNIALDDCLARILKTDKAHAGWEQVVGGVQARCTASTLLQHAAGELKLVKSRLEPVTMAVVTRSGNKKVTLVSNLEAYGFSLAALAHACQQGVAAACGVTRSPGARADQLMLQGDQTHFVAKLLIEKYGLPKKYVDGADKALKKKK